GAGAGKIMQKSIPIFFLIISTMVSATALSPTIWQGSALARGGDVGVNVNGFQNLDATQQEAVVQQLATSGVRCVRTSLRPDDKNIRLAQELQDRGIGLVLVLGAEFLPNAPVRPADAERHMRSARPLSWLDPERSRASYQSVFDKLDASG